MFEDRSGRLAKNVEDALAYIWKFIAENKSVTDVKMLEQSHDFDLYLPWLVQIFDRHGEQPGETFTMSELESLYMDAAWALVMQGFLRPGPRSISGDQPRDGLGNGYALTAKGRDRVPDLGKPRDLEGP